jgi:hypothetical protein
MKEDKNDLAEEHSGTPYKDRPDITGNYKARLNTDLEIMRSHQKMNELTDFLRSGNSAEKH